MIKLPPTLLLVVVIIAFTLLFQGSRGIWEPDEGRYTNIAANMLKRRDFVTPMLNDDLPHFAKPPGTYWAVAAGMATFGWNEWGARMANAVAFAGTAAALVALATTLSFRSPWIPAAVYATTAIPVIAANVITPDTLLTLWETLAVLGFLRWWPGDRGGGRRWLFLMWSAFGLAFITKGPPGLLPLLVIIVYVATRRGWRALGRVATAEGLAAFLLVGISWYIVVAASRAGLLTYFLRDEIIGRVAGSGFRRHPEWYGPLVVYLPTLLFGTLPWSLAYLAPSHRANLPVFRRDWWRDLPKRDSPAFFLALWILIPLAVFCVSRSRLPLYILPLFVPLALVTGAVVEGWLERHRWVPLAVGVFLIAVKAGAAWYPAEKDTRGFADAIRGVTRTLPAEVVFVDMTPRWGLNLYLRCDVERVASAGKGDGETLRAEMEKREPRTLVVMRKASAERILADLRDMRLAPHVLGSYYGVVFVDPTGELMQPSALAASGSP